MKQLWLAAALLLTACQDPMPSDWTGKWDGPEGTYLQITKTHVIISDLDGPKEYESRYVGDHLVFTREGTTETITAGTGEETGMKWLQEKKNCLIVKTGEGFCRD